MTDQQMAAIDAAAILYVRAIREAREALGIGDPVAADVAAIRADLDRAWVN